MFPCLSIESKSALISTYSSLVMPNSPITSSIVGSNDDAARRNGDCESRSDVDRSRSDVDRSRSDVGRSRSDVDRSRSDVDRSRSDVDRSRSDVDRSCRETACHEHAARNVWGDVCGHGHASTH